MPAALDEHRRNDIKAQQRAKCVQVDALESQSRPSAASIRSLLPEAIGIGSANAVARLEAVYASAEAAAKAELLRAARVGTRAQLRSAEESAQGFPALAAEARVCALQLCHPVTEPCVCFTAVQVAEPRRATPPQMLSAPLQAAGAVMAQRTLALSRQLEAASHAGAAADFSQLVQQAAATGMDDNGLDVYRQRRHRAESACLRALETVVAAQPFSHAAYDAMQREVRLSETPAR